MRSLLTAMALLTVLALPLAALAPPARAQPEVTGIDPQDGAVLSEPPQVIRICFSEPVRHERPDDYRFSVLTPEKRGLGFRTVFNRDGTCADVYPGRPVGSTRGLWTFQWQVLLQATGKPASGSVSFTVTREASPGQAPAGPLATPQATGPDVLQMALLTTASILGAGVVGLLLYLVRLRIGFWLHRPPPRESGGGEAQH